ncbi:MAG: ABC transporter ATP-binding protein [Nitrospinota bacterium]|nr:MAG: ABC transporter ATP-binding protein [Nitrospinota bacterium]
MPRFRNSSLGWGCEMLLQVEELDFSIETTQILRSISFSVAPEEIVCLVGRNGAGKSSILKTIIGLYTPRSGKILLHGQDITSLSPRERVLRGIGYSPEDSRVFADLTVAENLVLSTWITGHTSRAERISFETIFAIFPEIRQFLHRKGLHLSGGQKKMVSVARALALSPSILLLDESFEGLAPIVVKRFREALKRIHEMGITILLAESNIRIASQVADRSYLVERGEIIFEGHPQEILQNEKLLRIIGR